MWLFQATKYFLQRNQLQAVYQVSDKSFNPSTQLL